MKRLLLGLLAAVLLAPSVHAQQALPGLVGIPRGTTGCQYLAAGETLGNGASSLLQCNSAGQLLTSSALTQGGSALSATNGGYQNILQVNVALSATNGVFANVLQGNAVLSTTNPIFVTGTGTAGSAATNPITIQGIASMTPLLANPGTAANWAIGATAGTLPANASLAGCAGLSTQQTAVTTGQLTGCVTDLDGKLTNLPYAPRAMMSRGSGTSSATGTAITVLVQSGTSGVYEYLTSMQCSNTSATTLYVTLNDTASSVFIVPAGSGTNPTFPVPLRSNSANSALTATLSSSNGPVYCNGQGFNSL